MGSLRLSTESDDDSDCVVALLLERDKGTAKYIGSGLLLPPSRVLTAFHCIGNRATASVTAEHVYVVRGETQLRAIPDEHLLDPVLDVAVLNLDLPMHSSGSKVPMMASSNNGDWFVAHGFPLSRPFPRTALSVSGQIVNIARANLR